MTRRRGSGGPRKPKSQRDLEGGRFKVIDGGTSNVHQIPLPPPTRQLPGRHSQPPLPHMPRVPAKPPVDHGPPAHQVYSEALEGARTLAHNRGRLAILTGVGGLTVGAGGGYLFGRKKHAMSKNLVNPFEEVVVFGKAYPVVDTTMGVTHIRALVPTGGHVGHANALTHVRGPHSGGPATRLERYSGPHSGGRVRGVLRATGGHGGKKSGLEHYSKGFFKPRQAAKAVEETSAEVQRGLDQIKAMPRNTTKPKDMWGPSEGRQSPFSEGPSRKVALENYGRLKKAFGGTTGYWSQQGTVGRGLEMVARQPKAKRVPKPPKVANAARNAMAVAARGR